MLKKIILTLIFLYTVMGFVVIPIVAKPQIIDIVSQETNAKISIEDISFNPFAFIFEISGLELSSLDGKELVKLKSVSVNLELHSLFKSAIHIKSFVLNEPEIFLVLDKNKQINLSSIAKKSTETKTPVEEKSEFKMPRIIVDRVAVVGGAVNYEDYSQKSKFEFALDNIGFELNNIDTKDLDTSGAKINFYTLLSDGGFIKFDTEVVSLEPLIVKGNFDFEASKLYTQWRYMKDSLNLEVADGKLAFITDYYLNMDKLDSLTLSNLRIDLDKLRVKPKGNYPDVLTLNSFKIQNATIKPLAQDIHIDKISLDSLYVKASRDKKGNIDWLEFIKMELDTPKAQEIEKELIHEIEEEKQVLKLLVDEIALEKIKIDFDDSGVRPKVHTALNELNIYAQNVTLDGKTPLKYQINLLLNDKFKCSSNGSVIHSVLDLQSNTKCSDLNIVHYRPYIDTIAKGELKVYNIKLRSLIAGFDANVSVKDMNSTMLIEVTNANLNLKKFALNKRSTNRRLVNFSSFDVSGVTLNSQTKEIGVKNTTLKYLSVNARRLKDGKLNLEDLVVPKSHAKPKAKKKTKSSKKEKEYRVRLKKVSLQGAKIGFEDRALTPSVKSKIDRIYFTAYNIDSKKYSWMSYRLSARVNGSGKIKAKGSLRHTPLKQKGSIKIDKISLKEITPYLKETTFVSLDDGYLSLDTKTKYAVSKTKPDISIDGGFKINEFFVSDTRDKSSIVSFNEINLKSFSLELFPHRLFVDEVDINSFYVNAIVDANKTMNLASLTKPSGDENLTIQENNTTVASIDDNSSKEPAFPFKIMKINVALGSAQFADESLFIPFKTHMHNLNGTIYAVSNTANETTLIDINGDIDKYGSTKLKGSVNSSNPKAFTDLDFNFRNLDLSAMSGYSGTFAGHKIENGKLFLNLNYDIVESVLNAENSIIVKNIELGESVEIEGGSSLPLGFVIALLEDSDGIIDIDMPIKGNVDEPDFKYGALAWKTFGNLILRAVASPFSFLGSMMGIDGDSLEYAEFEGASLVILPPEREKLDNVAKLLLKRPKIFLSIAGAYDATLDKESLQKKKLADLVVKESGAKNDEERVNAMTIDLLEDIYEDARDDDKLDDIEDALDEKFDGDEFDRAYLMALVKECTEIQEVTIEELKTFARDRSKILKTYLVDTKGIEESRVKELDIIEVTSDAKKLIKTKLEVIMK